MAGKKKQNKVAKKQNERKKANGTKKRQELGRARLQKMSAEKWLRAHGKEIASDVEAILQKEEGAAPGTTAAEAGNETAAATASGPEATLLARTRAWAANSFAVEKDEAAAMCNDLLALARTGCWEAMEILYDLFRNKRPGLLPEDLEDRFVSQLQDVADQRTVDLYALLGRIRAESVLAEKDEEQAVDFLRHAWDGGSVKAGNRLAHFVLQEDDSALGVSEGVPILLLNAQNGNVEAMELLGERLLGNGKLLHDLGMRLLHLAARRGRTGRFMKQALYDCLDSGSTAPLRSALEDPALDGPAQWCLQGLARLAGLFAPASVEEGLALLERAAHADFGPACGRLADIHLCGLWGVKPDREKARFWIARGIGLDDPRCLALERLIPFVAPSGRREPAYLDDEARDLIFWSADIHLDTLAGICACIYAQGEKQDVVIPVGAKERQSHSLSPAIYDMLAQALSDREEDLEDFAMYLDHAEMGLDPLPFFLLAGLLNVVARNRSGALFARDICAYFFNGTFDSLDECVFALNQAGALLATPNSLDRLLNASL